MRRWVAFVFVLGSVGLHSQERLVLEKAVPTTTEYRLVALNLRWGDPDQCVVEIWLRPNVGEQFIQHQYSGTAACGLLREWNTANLTMQSLQRRAIEQLVKDKIVTGTVQGKPVP